MLPCRPLSGRTVCRLARPRHGGTGTTPVALRGRQPVSVVKALRDRMQLQVAGGTHAGSNSAGAVPRPMPRRLTHCETRRLRDTRTAVRARLVSTHALLSCTQRNDTIVRHRRLARASGFRSTQGARPGIPRAAKRDACETPRPLAGTALAMVLPGAPRDRTHLTHSTAVSYAAKRDASETRHTLRALPQRVHRWPAPRSVFPRPRQGSPSGDQISLSPPDRSSLSPGGRPATKRTRDPTIPRPHEPAAERTRDSGHRAAPAPPTAVLR
jgi:hypothetical protein